MANTKKTTKPADTPLASTIDALNEKIEDLYSFCATNNIPFACLYVAQEQTNVKILTPKALGIKLKNDKITPMLAYACTDDFKIVLLKKEDVYDESDFRADGDIYTNNERLP